METPRRGVFRGGRIFAARSDYAMGAESRFPTLRHALQMRFPATERVASLAMVRGISLGATRLFGGRVRLSRTVMWVRWASWPATGYWLQA